MGNYFFYDRFLSWIVTVVLLVLYAGLPAYAEWVAIGSTGNGETMFYVDPDTIRRKGNIVKVWELDDFKTTQTDAHFSYLSSKVQKEYDCIEENRRILTLTYFSGNMGSGKVVKSISNEAPKWRPIEPGSMSQAMWNAACAKK